jgi:hypothetical protein
VNGKTDELATTQELNLTTVPVQLPGVDPAEAPSEVLPGRLWHGGVPVDFEWLAGQGIEVVIDLSDADSYPPADRIKRLTYLKCPLVDGDVPDEGLAVRLAQLVAGLVEDGRQILVHCTFGRNRSGLLMTLVVREVLGLTGAEALDYVRQRRANAVNNEGFAQWLRALPAPEA